MSELFKSPFPTFYKSDGVTVNSRGYLHFYEPGSGTTDKDIYADKTLSSARRLTNPVRLGLTGQLETNVYLNGDYKVVLKDSAGVTIDTVSNYSPPDFSSQFAAYDASVTYSVGDYSLASNGKVYRSLTGGNTANEPSSSPENWEEIYFTSVYNSNRSYEENDIVKFEGGLYTSLQGDNLNNAPNELDSEYWRSFFDPGILTNYTAAAAAYRNSDGYNTTSFLASTEIAESTWNSIGKSGSGANQIWSAMSDVPDGAKFVIVSAFTNFSRTSTTDLPFSSILYARATGGIADIDVCRVAQFYENGGVLDANITDITEFTVPLDSSGRFDFRWQADGENGGFGVRLYLVGFYL